jgi:hypothetical protein
MYGADARKDRPLAQAKLHAGDPLLVWDVRLDIGALLLLPL